MQTSLANDARVVVSDTIAQPLAWGSQFRTVKPNSKTATRNIGGQTITGTVVSGSELLSFVYSPSNYTGGYVVQAFEFAPRYSILPLLDQLSMIYKRYNADTLALKFIPFTPTTTPGRIGLYASADPSAPFPTSFVDFLRLSQQQTSNIYMPLTLQISPNSEGSYLPGTDSAKDAANIRQTFTCQLGYAYEAPGSTTPVQLGAVICAYEFFFWDLIDPTQVTNPSDYNLLFDLPNGANVRDITAFAPFWVQSQKTPGLWKYFGSEQVFAIEIQGYVDADQDITTILPKLYDAFLNPLDPLSTFDAIASYSNIAYTNPNVVSGSGKYKIGHGGLLSLPDVTLLGALKLQLQFSTASDAPTSIFDF